MFVPEPHLMFRSNYDKKTGQSPNTPREQTNSMTSWIDASFVYSTKVQIYQTTECLVHRAEELDLGIFDLPDPDPTYGYIIRLKKKHLHYLSSVIVKLC